MFDSVVFETLLEKYVINGGVMMFVLVPCSLLMLGAILQGMIRLRRGRVLPADLLRKARHVNSPEQRVRFIRDLQLHPSPLGRVLRMTLNPFYKRTAQPDQQEIGPVMDQAIVQVSDQMSDSLGMLSTLYTVSPLLGIMGTMLGMMNTFYEFGVRGQKSVDILTIGIQEALVTSLWGLAIAIPAYVGAYWLQGRIRAYERDGFPKAVHQVVQALFEEHAAANEPQSEAAAVAAVTPTGAEGQA